MYPQYVPGVPGISPGPHFQTKHGLMFIHQNLKGKHSFVGATAFLYNLTKSAPDPFVRRSVCRLTTPPFLH